MSARSGRSPLPVNSTPAFTRQLGALSRKHHKLRESVDKALAELATKGSVGVQLPSVDGHSVFKVRLPLNGHGKRGGARMICAIVAERVWGLFVYKKSNQETVAAGALTSAIRDLPDVAE